MIYRLTDRVPEYSLHSSFSRSLTCVCVCVCVCVLFTAVIERRSDHIRETPDIETHPPCHQSTGPVLESSDSVDVSRARWKTDYFVCKNRSWERVQTEGRERARTSSWSKPFLSWRIFWMWPYWEAHWTGVRFFIHNGPRLNRDTTHGFITTPISGLKVYRASLSSVSTAARCWMRGICGVLLLLLLLLLHEELTSLSVSH